MAWWQGARQGFTKDQRYLDGTPFLGSGLLAALADGAMSRRHVHAWELALRTQGRRQVRTLAFTGRQRVEMSQAHPERIPTHPLMRLWGG